MKDTQKLLVKYIRKYGSEDPEDVFSDGLELTDNIKRVRELIDGQQSVSETLGRMSLQELETFISAVSEYHEWMDDRDAFYGEDPFERGQNIDSRLCSSAGRVRTRCSHRMF